MADFLPLNTLIGVGPGYQSKPTTPDETHAAEQDRPGWLKMLPAAFRTDNTVGSLMAREDMPDPLQKEDGFDWSKAMDGLDADKYGDLYGRFVDVHNQRAFDGIRAQIDSEEDDRRTLAAGGWRGTVASVAAGGLDLPTLIPVGGLFASLGKSVGATALRTAAGAAIGVGVQEAALQATQETRTVTESAVNIGVGTIMGGVLGGAAGLLTRGERQAVQAAIARQIAGDEAAVAVSGEAASAGAAATERMSREALTPSGTLGKAATEFAQINPNNRLNMSPSPIAREVGQKMADNAVYQEMHDAGKSLGPSVEILSRQAFNERMAGATKDADAIYRDYRKSTKGAMSAKEFDEAVGRAMVNNDVDPNGNGFVSRVASTWREKVIEPFKNDAISVGMLPEDIKTTTAPSYLHRVWNRQKLLQGETRFKAIAAQWMREAIPDGEAMTKKGARLLDEQDLKDYIDEAVNAVFDKLTGRIHDEAATELPDWIVPIARGPLKDRTFSIPDALVEDFLDRDIRQVAHKYARIMAADVETTRKFGRADLRDQITEVMANYTKLREQVNAAKTIDDARKIADVGLTYRSKDDVLKYLFKAESQDIQDIKALRDLVRGSFSKDSDSAWARISRAAVAFNYIRLMGGATIANLSDIFRPAMVHGLGRYMTEGIAPLVTNLKGVKMAVAEAQEAGIVVERVLHERLMSIAEVGDRFAENTKFERLLQNGTRVASRWNGILLFTDAAKSVASVMSQNRMIKGILNGGDERYLAYLGIDQNMVSRMRREMQTFAKNNDGIWVANSGRWEDDTLRRTFRAALMRDVDSIVVQRSVGDVPLFANTPTGKMLLQFRSFSLAAHQRVLTRGLQESKINFVSGLTAMTSLGIMVSYLRAMRGGSERFEKFQKAAENPGYLIGEGLDMSGIFTLGFEVANTAEKITKRNPIKDPLKWALGDPNVGESQRFSSRGVAGALLGPSVGLIDMLSTISQRAAGKIEGTSTDAQDKALVRQSVQLVPFYSYPGAREMINRMIE